LIGVFGHEAVMRRFKFFMYHKTYRVAQVFMLSSILFLYGGNRALSILEIRTT